MKKLLFVMALLWGGGGLGFWYYNETQSQHFVYRTVAVSRGDLLATINATGTIEPQDVVDVGAQIAGEIQSFGQDPRDPTKPISYGSPVEQGTVLARIADSLFKARVDQMKASVATPRPKSSRRRPSSSRASSEFDRSLNLFRPSRVPAAEHDTAIANLETADASLALSKSGVELAKANLEEAEVNLGYTTIKSPVKGVILDRRVNIGQTVVSSLNAPSLFLIAKDLSRMEIWASVNETDIGVDPPRPGRPVHRRVVPQGHASRDRRADPAQRQHDPERRHLHRGGRRRQRGRQAPALPDGPAPVRGRGAQGGPPRAQRRAPVEAQAGAGRADLSRRLRQGPPLPGHREPRARAGRRPTPPTAPRPSGSGSGEFVRPVDTKVGLSDGLKTEIAAGGDLIEGSQVVIGQVLAGEADEPRPSPAHRPSRRSCRTSRRTRPRR